METVDVYSVLLGALIGFVAFMAGALWGYDRGYKDAMHEAYEGEYGDC